MAIAEPHGADAGSPSPVLELRAVSLSYGGLQALDSVDVAIHSGSITGLIGPNGAGKTSMFDVVTGLTRPTKGEVFLHGQDVTHARPARRARLGLGRTFQRLELFSSLTVRENVAVAAESAHRARFSPGRWHLTTSQAREAADRQLETVGLGDVADRRVDTLSTGTARLVEVARSLAARPSVLLLDEPASGLDTNESGRLADLLGTLAAAGIGVLIVEHDVELVMRVCSHVFVLDRGTVIAAGTPAAVRSDPAVRAAYLGQMALP